VREAYGYFGFNGWIGTLFPYLGNADTGYKKRNPLLSWQWECIGEGALWSEVSLFSKPEDEDYMLNISSANIPTGLSSVTMGIQAADGSSNSYRLYAGFSGITQGQYGVVPERRERKQLITQHGLCGSQPHLVLRPFISWSVYPCDRLENVLNKLAGNGSHVLNHSRNTFGWWDSWQICGCDTWKLPGSYGAELSSVFMKYSQLELYAESARSVVLSPCQFPYEIIPDSFQYHTLGQVRAGGLLLLVGENSWRTGKICYCELSMEQMRLCHPSHASTRWQLCQARNAMPRHLPVIADHLTELLEKLEGSGPSMEHFATCKGEVVDQATGSLESALEGRPLTNSSAGAAEWEGWMNGIDWTNPSPELKLLLLPYTVGGRLATEWVHQADPSWVWIPTRGVDDDDDDREETRDRRRVLVLQADMDHKFLDKGCLQQLAAQLDECEDIDDLLLTFSYEIGDGSPSEHTLSLQRDTTFKTDRDRMYSMGGYQGQVVFEHQLDALGMSFLLVRDIFEVESESEMHEAWNAWCEALSEDQRKRDKEEEERWRKEREEEEEEP